MSEDHAATARRLRASVRTCRFVPGDVRDLAGVAATTTAEALFVDLEDGVSVAHKASARAQVAALVAKPIEQFTFVRINALGSSHVVDDIAAVAGRSVAVLVPMIRSVAEVQEVDRLLAEQEAARGVAIGSTPVLLMIETAPAVARAIDILGASTRVVGSVFGPADYALDLGCRTVSDRGFDFAPMLTMAYAQIVQSAAALGMASICPPQAPVDAPDEYLAQARKLYDIGYTATIGGGEPQLQLLHEASRPRPEELEYAQGVLDQAATAAADGNALSYHRGWMVEGPYIEMARRTVARGEAVGSAINGAAAASG